jgi:tetratricopeptide (TPR) repeat protein
VLRGGAWKSRLGQFYIEARDFDKAYQNYSEALRIRRITAERLAREADRAASDPLVAEIFQAIWKGPQVTAPSKTWVQNPKNLADLEASAKTVRSVYRPHPAVLLVQLGRLDFANGDLTHASEKYAEAISIGDEYPRLEKP